MKRDLPPQNIKLKASESGAVEWTTGFFCLIILSVTCVFVMKVYDFFVVGCKLQDSLTSALLAASLIDLQEYGTTNEIVIGDVEGAYEIFVQSLEDNLAESIALKEERPAGSFDGYSVDCFYVINVKSDSTLVYKRDAYGKITATEFAPGQEVIVEGKRVTRTGLYAEISMPVKVYGESYVYARTSKLTDIYGDKKEYE